MGGTATPAEHNRNLGLTYRLMNPVLGKHLPTAGTCPEWYICLHALCRRVRQRVVNVISMLKKRYADPEKNKPYTGSDSLLDFHLL
jgi:hypothetical protein